MKEERTEHVEHSVDIKKFTLTEKSFRESNFILFNFFSKNFALTNFCEKIVSLNFCNFDTVRKEVDKMNGETYLIGRRVHMKSFTHAINNMRKSIFYSQTSTV